MDDWGRLLSGCPGKTGPQVRILSSPHFEDRVYHGLFLLNALYNRIKKTVGCILPPSFSSSLTYSAYEFSVRGGIHPQSA